MAPRPPSERRRGKDRRNGRERRDPSLPYPRLPGRGDRRSPWPRRRRERRVNRDPRTTGGSRFSR